MADSTSPLTNIDKVFEQALASVSGVQTGFTTFATQWIFIPLVMIAVSTFVIKYLMEEGDMRKIMGEIIRTIILASFVTAALTSTGAFSYQAWTGFVASVVKKIGGSNNPNGEITAVAGSFMGSVVSIWEAEVAQPSPTGTADGKTAGWLDKGKELWTASTDAPGFFMIILMKLIGLAAKLVAILFLGLALAVFVGEYLVAQLMVHIAMMVGPLFIPWIVWQPTSFLFDGWKKFLITSFLGAAIMVLVANTVAGTIADYLTSAMSQLTTAKNNSLEVLTADYLQALLLVCLLAALLPIIIQKASGIANGLLSGHTISGGGGMFGAAAAIATKAAVGAAASVATGPSPRTGGGGTAGGGGSASDRGTNIGNKNISGGLAQHAGRAAMAAPGAAMGMARGLNAAAGASAAGITKAFPKAGILGSSALQKASAATIGARESVARGWDKAKANPGLMGVGPRAASSIANTVGGAVGKVADGAKGIAAATVKGAETGAAGQAARHLNYPMMGPPAPSKG